MIHDLLYKHYVTKKKIIISTDIRGGEDERRKIGTASYRLRSCVLLTSGGSWFPLKKNNNDPTMHYIDKT
jgi:hypothetical protein